MKTNLFLSLVLAVAIFGCGNGNYSVNSSKESLSKTEAVASVSGCTITPAMQAWNALSQSAKDLKLFSVALYDDGKDFSASKLQCKPWVQKVVFAASGITVPGTQSGDCSWGNDPCGNIISRGSAAPSDINSMDIIQMRWRCRLSIGGYETGPHTAIVISKDATSMKWIYCNYVKAYTVGMHTITFADFAKFTGPNSGASGTGYTVYHVR
ncbi:MAG: hypothetical protein PHO56_03780 [Patescibacteria group bacterium]|nr:hypothetical protein [Patescibacteria group bacterium]